MKMSVQHRFDEVAKQARQIPDIARQVARQAVAETIKAGRESVYAAMRRGFDRPTPFAMRALRVELPVDGGPLQGQVMVKGRVDVAGGAIPPESFLRAQIEGGRRRDKRFEVALRRAGLLPAGWLAVPGPAARRDVFGNMTGSHISQLMAWLQLYQPEQSGRRKNSSDAKLARLKRGTRNRFGVELFVSSPTQPKRSGGLRPGIWQRQTGRVTTRSFGPAAPLRAVVLFVPPHVYRQRLDFFGELQRSSAATLPVQIDRAAAAVRRARPLRDVR